MLTNLATVFVGMGLYFAFLGLTQFVQIPHGAAGYGFGATVLEASVVYLLPGAITGFLVALVSGRFIDRFGARPVLMIAAVAGIVGFLFIALAHDAPWQIIAASILANAYIALGYGALPALVVAEVDAGETGVATSMNAIARTIGSSTAAALVAVLLGPHHLPVRADGEQLRRHLHRRRGDRGTGDGADRVLAPAGTAVSNPSRRATNLVP